MIGESPGLSNVTWSLIDSIAGCPAGDTLIFTHPGHRHPSLLRIYVCYSDPFGFPKVGVPPESIYVRPGTAQGNLKLNDKGVKIFADDSTDGFGFTRITIPSFSGCGSMPFTLTVSGYNQGQKTARVRTTDADADNERRVTSADQQSPCDINYDGAINSLDRDSVVAFHLSHWKRHALHGTLVRRTNLCEICGVNANNTIGAGDISWSLDGKRLAFSGRDTCPACTLVANPCRIKFVPSDPAMGNQVRNLTFNGAASDSEDYDPSWSPLAPYIFYVRDDRVIHRKGVPGLIADTSDIALIGSSVSKTTAQVSPDGDSLAYVEYVGGFQQVFISPAVGGSRRQLTSDNTANFYYPKWSPDGDALIVTRVPLSGRRGIYKIRVRASPTPAPTPLFAPSDRHAEWAAYAPDSQVVVAGVDPSVSAPKTHTIDATGSTTSLAIRNYPDFTYSFLHPRPSPDGTRTALLGKDPRVPSTLVPQVWVARRNMSLPPQITSVGATPVADSTLTVAFTVVQGTPYSYLISAADPEGDAVKDTAFFLQPWMSYNVASHTLSVNPGGTVGKTYDVVLHVATPSGGTDGLIARFTVGSSGGGSRSRAPRSGEEVPAEGPNPTRGRFSLSTPFMPQTVAEFEVFDLAGRRVATVRVPSGRQLVWEGVDIDGNAVPNGVYAYRLRVGAYLKAGKVVVLR